MKTPRKDLCFPLLALFFLALPGTGFAQRQPGSGGAPALLSALPDAPDVQPQASPHQPAGSPVASDAAASRAYVIEPGESAAPLPGAEKMAHALRRSMNPLFFVGLPLLSAGYEQLTDGDPRYGSDSGAFAARFGAAVLRSSSTRIFSDGIFAAALHQDPRYYRIANGSIVNRGLRSAERALVRRGDDGSDQLNSSGLLGRAAAAVLTLAYYPSPSRRSSVVLSTFGLSIASDAGGDLVLEFLPDLARRFPILKKIELH